MTSSCNLQKKIAKFKTTLRFRNNFTIHLITINQYYFKKPNFETKILQNCTKLFVYVVFFFLKRKESFSIFCLVN